VKPQPTPVQVLRQLARGLAALCDLLEQGPPPSPDLIPLASLPIGRKAALAAVHRGALPAILVGRRYMVRREDVAKLLEPKARAPKPRRGRESETAKIQRQLREAGITVADGGRV
jgi:hypothetical protein